MTNKSSYKKAAKLETTLWDATQTLESEAQVLAYIEAAFEEGEPALITQALGDVARSKGMAAIAQKAGVTREALYKALTSDGDPRLSTFMGVLKALGLRLVAVAA